MADDAHRRRRRRARPAVQPAAEAAPTSDAPTPTRDAADEQPARRRPTRDPSERGLRDLVGSGHSMLGVEGALRARDVNRPTDEDLAEAERDVVIVRRHWRPDSRS